MNWTIFLQVFAFTGGLIAGTALLVGIIHAAVWLSENKGWKALTAFLLAIILITALLLGWLVDAPA